MIEKRILVRLSSLGDTKKNIKKKNKEKPPKKLVPVFISFISFDAVIQFQHSTYLQMQGNVMSEDSNLSHTSSFSSTAV